MPAAPFPIDVRLAPDSLFNEIVGEAFVIAGRVSLWVPIERLGFDGWLLKDQLRLSKRLAAMQVEVAPERSRPR